ncbi:MAG: PAS domain-containing protein, partial [Alphaproteobacteria bacterium]|nr:PAS domain-containing protein [Alphaproteobacteria bacterium]
MLSPLHTGCHLCIMIIRSAPMGPSPWSDAAGARSMHEQVLHPDDLADGRLRQLFELWLAAMGGAKMPARKFADPIALHFLFGSLVLFEIERNPLRFRYRLFGTDLSNQLGIDPTGQYVNESKDKQAGIEMACLLNGVAIDGLPCRAFAKTDV